MWWNIATIVASQAGLQHWIGAAQELLTDRQSPGFAFSQTWEVLGPFQIGTREATWGADPLEYYGGFHNLKYDETAHFKSSLPFNGTVTWSKTEAKVSSPDPSSASAGLSIYFPDVDWRALQDVYGWAALQWQGWARGEIYVQSQESRTLALHVKGGLECIIDGERHFGSDYYSYGRVPLTLHLDPGVHVIELRLVRDVRVNGGIAEPSVDLDLSLESSGELLKPVRLRDGDPYGMVMHSDLAGGDFGPLASLYGSVMLRNDAQEDIYVYGIDASRDRCRVELVEKKPIRFVSGQTRPVAFRLACLTPVAGRGPVSLEFFYRIQGQDLQGVVDVRMWPLARGLHAPQKMTFMHPAGVVSYAILRPPSPNAHCAANVSAPVMLALHGAGLEAEINQVRHYLDPVPDLCAWVLFPTGGSPWSGDDWHQWGFADVQAAINAIPDWIEQVEWDGIGVDINSWFVSGHSNGGQGTWYALTHWPDKVFAAAAVAGYSSIQNYVPYHFWSVADAGRTAVVQSALNSYRHELLLENAAGIPILEQHGSADDNVPPYHSRLLSQLLEESGANSTYVEMLGKGHWYDNVMTSQPLVDFYRQHLNNKNSAAVQPKLYNFSIVSTNTGDMGTKNGFQIMEPKLPGQLGKIHVEVDEARSTCIITTSNIRSFRAPRNIKECGSIILDHQEMHEVSLGDALSLPFFKRSGEWQLLDSALVPSSGSQSGGINGVLRTTGAFTIVHHSAAAKKVALQISRNLCQYYGADTVLTGDYAVAKRSAGTRISVVIGGDLPDNDPDFSHSIHVFNDRVRLKESDGSAHIYMARDGLAAIFLRPVMAERPELVIWGVDEASLEVAARLAPMLSGVGQPDFVVADRSMMWKGVEGTLAMGFYDGQWNISKNSYFV